MLKGLNIVPPPPRKKIINEKIRIFALLIAETYASCNIKDSIPPWREQTVSANHEHKRAVTD